MYIVNLFKKAGSLSLSDLTSTHPPISERIRILRNMTHGVSFMDYSNSFIGATGRKTIIPQAALTKEDVVLRQASDEAKQQMRKQTQIRQVGDIMRQVQGFLFLNCLCGLSLKIPPNYKQNSVTCPRCKRKLQIPTK